MRRLLVIIVGWLALTAQTAPTIHLANPQAREALSLAGKWRVIVDPLDTGQ